MYFCINTFILQDFNFLFFSRKKLEFNFNNIIIGVQSKCKPRWILLNVYLQCQWLWCKQQGEVYVLFAL